MLQCPAGLDLSFTTANSWQGDGGHTFYQHDFSLRNTGSETIRLATLMVHNGNAVTQCWNVEDGQSGGQRCWGFPAWLQQNGGLKAGEVLGFGGIFKGDRNPAISVHLHP